ncbi:MAG: hypothetical protein KOO60_10785 [Gemmatimonadales bacterium]|nr:hypothetical protein [Gemmatimonadales bacterium]
MKPENWTDYKHPCFVDYNGYPDDGCPDDCDWFDGSDGAHVCDYKEHLGGSWDSCGEGRLSHHCDWLPEEGKDE